jgi:adenylate cyclase
VDRDRWKASLKDLTQNLRDAITARVAESLEAEKFQQLAELGIIDEAALAGLPDDLSYEEAVRRFHDRIAELVAEAPSMLGRLDIRPFDVLPVETEPKAKAETVDRAVVFSDLEGFTVFTREHGDASASAMLDDHYTAVDEIVRSRGGRVLKTLGDGHMISFHEPAASVMACVDLVEMNSGPLPLRAGGHFGPVIPTKNDLLGHVVNVASRVADLAAGGESLITTRLRDEAGNLPRVLFEGTRTASVRGLTETVEVCRVRRAS